MKTVYSQLLTECKREGDRERKRERKKKKDTVTQFYLDKENKIKRYGIIQIAAQCDHQTVPKFSHVTCLFFQVPVVVYCGILSENLSSLTLL